MKPVSGNFGVWSGREAELWRMRENWRRSGEPYPAVVPFADKVAMRTKTDAIRVRRDFPTVMELTMASAVLNKAERATDAERRLLATVEDYAAAVSAAFGKSPAARAARQAFPSAEEIETALSQPDQSSKSEVEEPTP